MTQQDNGARDPHGHSQRLGEVDLLRRLIEADAALRQEGEFVERYQRPDERGSLDERDPDDNYSPGWLRDVIDGMGEPDGSDGSEADAPVEGVLRARDVTEPLGPSEAPAQGSFRAFPSELLPEPVRGFVELGAEVIGCDRACLALPMLAGLAAAVGNTRRLRLKWGFSVPAILWSAVVGESGTAKSPAFELALGPFLDRQTRALQRHAAALKQYKADLAEYKRAEKDWERVLRGDEPLEKPVRPVVERSIVNDTTVQALGPLLLGNPRGLLLARDELAGWVGTFDRYFSGRGGAEAGHWLTMHNAAGVVIDRKSRAGGSVCVPRASVSVTGCLQPAGLRRAVASGLSGRLLLSWPPFVPREWSDAEMCPEAEARMAELIDRLYELQPAEAEGASIPVVLELTPEGQSEWTRYYNAHVGDQSGLPDELSAAWSKLAEYAARLALVLHCVRWGAGDEELEDAERVDAVSVGAAIELARWFAEEARRVYALAGVWGTDPPRRRLLEWILHKGGTVTVRDVQRGMRCYKTTTEAEAALTELVDAGDGHWVVTPRGRSGQPTRRFRASAVDSS